MLLYMKINWDFFVGVFYNYPQVQMLHVKFSSSQSVGNAIISGVALYEKMDSVDINPLPMPVKIKREQEIAEKEITTIPISRYPVDFNSGVYLLKPNRTYHIANEVNIEYLRENMQQMDVEAIWVSIDETIYKTDSQEGLVMLLAKNRIEREGFTEERRAINELFYEEIFREVSLLTVESREDLAQEVRQIKPLLSEGIVQDVVDYIITTGAIAPA